MDKEGRSPLLSAQDPYYAVRDALEGELITLQAKFDGWKGLLHSVDTSADPVFKQRHEELKRDLTKVGDFLRKVRASVLNVEQNRAKFSHIDDRELASRKAALDSLEATLTGMRTNFHSRETDNKLASDERKAVARRVNRDVEDSSRSSNSYAQGNAAFLAGAGGEQKMIARQQDEMVLKMGEGLSTLKEMASAINSELKEQDVIIEDIDKGTDKAQSTMDTTIKTIEKLTGAKSGCQLWTIFALVVVFVIVVIIALW